MFYLILLLLLGIGVVSWIIGQSYGYVGIAVLGAAFILIAGSAIALTGVQVQSGMVKTTNYTTVNNSVVANSSSTHYTYATRSVGAAFGVGVLGSLGIGGLLMLLGALMMGQTLAEVSN